jgi:hypothetical protein
VGYEAQCNHAWGRRIASTQRICSHPVLPLQLAPLSTCSALPAAAIHQHIPGRQQMYYCTHSDRCITLIIASCKSATPTCAPPDHTQHRTYCICCCFCYCSPSNLSRSRPATPTNGGSSSPHVTPRGASSPSLVWRQQAAAQLSGDYQSYPFGKQSDNIAGLSVFAGIQAQQLLPKTHRE